MGSIDDLISSEIRLYVECCKKAAEHDAQEKIYKALAHMAFLHIQDLRSSRQYTDFL